MSGPVSWEDYATGPSECAPEWSWAWEGLVGLWAPALGPTGNALFDLSGRGNHGTLTNMDPATAWVGSPYGWALDFDGSDDHIHCGNITNTSQLTLVAVLNEYTNGDTYRHIASQRTSAGRNWNWFIRRSGESGGIDRKLTVAGGGSNEVRGTISLEDATPYLVAATIDGTVGSLYVNGVLDAAGAVDAITNNALPTLIGCRYLAGTTVNTPLNGSLAFVGISSRAWSSEEIRAWTADPFALLRPAGFSPELWYIAAGGGTAYTSTLTDAIGLADSITRAMTRAITDALNSSDTILRATARTVTEALTIADAVTRGTGRTITDAASLTDAILRGTSRALTDATSAADTITRGTGRAITDSIGATDPAILRAMARIYADTVGVADARNVAMARAIADALGLADTATVTLMGTAATGLRDVLVIVDTRDRLIIGDLRSILRVD